MYQYHISSTIVPSSEPTENCNILTFTTTDELETLSHSRQSNPIFTHLCPAKDIHTCKAETRHDCVSGTIMTPRTTKGKNPIAFSYLLTKKQLVLCDDSSAVHTMIQKLIKEKIPVENSTGMVFYALLELLIAKDMHHIQELEDRLGKMEDETLDGNIKTFNSRMLPLRKEIASWIRYYTQLTDVLCELQENENKYFTDSELRAFRMIEKRIDRLKAESQSLREYRLQVQELFQTEIDIRQNHIMKILTIVTTIFFPLSLLASWYGMNFKNMPELGWKYGYPVMIVVSLFVIFISLLIMKKKKFL